MQLIQKLYDHLIEHARQVKVTSLTIGLRYTVVTTDDGGMGVAFTCEGQAHGCARGKDYRDFENEPAAELLACIKDPSPLRRSMGLALVNALNYGYALALPDDSSDTVWMDALGIGSGTRLAMVGFFGPLMKKLEARGAQVEALDEGQGIGDRDRFYAKLDGWADALVLTSTTILNNSTEEVFAHLTPNVQAVMLGPSTPLIREAFDHLPVRVLAGTVPLQRDAVLRAVRHGQGTPVIHRYSRKVYTLATEVA